MDFSYNEEQEMLKKSARDFLENECTEKFVREMEASDTGHTPEIWRKVADLGWLGIAFPEKYGGGGMSFLDLSSLCEELGRAMFPGPFLSTMLCGLYILTAGSEEQKADLLPKIAKGDLIMALAFTEPEASWDGKAWDAEGITLPATAEGDNYVIKGTKLFVHDANVADQLLCVTRTKGGITVFLVDAKDPGISCTLLRTTAGDKQNKVVFNNVKVPKKNIVGELDGGWTPLSKVMQQAAVLLCSEMVGAGERVLEMTVDHAKTRIQFEQPIGINQYVQEHCVYLCAEVDGSRWLTHQAAWRLSEGLPCDMEVAIAKGWTSDSHERACWRAHQVIAGVGYTQHDGVLPLYSRRGKSLQLYMGDTRHHYEKIASLAEKWPTPVNPKGKALGLWTKEAELRIPDWFERLPRA